MRLHHLPLLAALSSLALADFKFTSPAAGASVPVGSVSVQWSDDGTAPALSTLSTYTLYLMVGGNDANSMVSFVRPLVSYTGWEDTRLCEGRRWD